MAAMAGENDRKRREDPEGQPQTSEIQKLEKGDFGKV
jgi:hypothetical protein